MTNQPALPAPFAPSGKRRDATMRDRQPAATPKRGSNRGDAVRGENPRNRKAGPG